MFYQLVGIANASFYDSQIRSSNQSSLEPTYDKTQVDIRLFNILYCTSKRKTPPPPNNQGTGNQVFQLIMKRIFLCNSFFIAKCIGDYVLDFVLVNVLLAGCWLLAAFAFFFPFPIIPSHFISFHLISSHFISFHLISFHSLSPAIFLQEMKWISI